MAKTSGRRSSGGGLRGDAEALLASAPESHKDDDAGAWVEAVKEFCKTHDEVRKAIPYTEAAHLVSALAGTDNSNGNNGVGAAKTALARLVAIG